MLSLPESTDEPLFTQIKFINDIIQIERFNVK